MTEETVFRMYQHPDANFNDEVELGWRVSGSLYRENIGPDWMKMMILQTRAE